MTWERPRGYITVAMRIAAEEQSVVKIFHSVTWGRLWCAGVWCVGGGEGVWVQRCGYPDARDGGMAWGRGGECIGAV